MLKRLVTLLGLVGLLVISGDSYAGVKCKIDFNYGVVVNNSQLRVLEESRTVLQINHKSQLFIGGEWIDLNTEQQAILNNYAEGMHYVVPKMVVLASEGVELAIDTIEQVYQGIVGVDHDSYEKLQNAMRRAKDKIRDKFRYASNHYFIAPGSLEQVDDFVDQQIEAQLGEAISTSLGGILSAISGLNTGDGDTEERMRALEERLEQMSVELEDEMGSRAENLRDKAKWFCHKIKHLNELEEQLRGSIKQFEAYDIIVETY
ncbi:DUF2884 family protein [Alteromonas sp. ASW11-36]|uniref:DUF2884 family protein n=1 Tax=Alteromonas arenosi TaxID=3055817 RepID=A0ABT7T0H8_9ALTE|nr:DUF2884 family protein [Alteromonas sp. ASW11-36]MDM7861937.1 DUF2884 family protein [Alteromonas sp. ASW11-36]